MDEILLEDREIIDIPMLSPAIRHFGVVLGHEEAQELIAKDLRVFGDELGPYLVVRIPSGRQLPGLVDWKHATITVAPLKWSAGSHSGTICWMKEVK